MSAMPLTTSAASSPEQKQAQSNGQDISQIHSVASFFVSRVDTEIDRRLKALDTPEADALLGEAGIANARLAYQMCEQTLRGPAVGHLANARANRQRLLRAPTGNASCGRPPASRTPATTTPRYVVELVAPGTVNTAPEKTIRAVRDHGVVRGNTIEGTYQEAAQIFGDLDAIGIDLGDVFDVLETEAVQEFEQSWTELVQSVSRELAKHKPTR
jgi:transaldolase